MSNISKRTIMYAKLDKDNEFVIFYRDRECTEMFSKTPTEYSTCPKEHITSIVQLNCASYNLVWI